LLGDLSASQKSLAVKVASPPMPTIISMQARAASTVANLRGNSPG
jgi:hypothetical protein